MTNKQNIYERLMAGLADKELSFGCMLLPPQGCVACYYVSASPRARLKDCDHCIFLKDQQNQQAVIYWSQQQLEETPILGHPIMLSTVLAKMKDCTEEQKEKLRQLWEACDIEASLQSLYESTEVIEYQVTLPPNDADGVKRTCECSTLGHLAPCSFCSDTHDMLRLKAPNIEALFRYLIDLGLVDLRDKKVGVDQWGL